MRLGNECRADSCAISHCTLKPNRNISCSVWQNPLRFSASLLNNCCKSSPSCRQPARPPAFRAFSPSVRCVCLSCARSVRRSECRLSWSINQRRVLVATSRPPTPRPARRHTGRRAACMRPSGRPEPCVIPRLQRARRRRSHAAASRPAGNFDDTAYVTMEIRLRRRHARRRVS